MATETIQPDSTNVKEILLPCGGVALVDAEDYERIAAVKWYSVTSKARRTTYARGRVGEISQGMHRAVLGLGKWRRGDPDVDHINGNGLDNRRCNLRIVTRRQNLLNTLLRRDNTSGYRGVHLKSSGRWRAEISVNGKIIVLGCYRWIEDAARAYDEAAIKYNGEFAKLNFPLAKAPKSL